MRLQRISIENFGVLHNFSLDLESQLHVFCEENGWGKSTLVAFLRVMFYGFQNEGVRKDVLVMNEREKYRPWQGGTYGGSVVFSVGEDSYELVRIFRENKKSDTFTLRDTKTNLVSDRFSTDIGLELFGLDADSFLKTIVFSQNDCLTRTTDRIVAKLTNLDALTDDLNSYEEADERLKNLINEYSPTRKTGKLYRITEDMAELDAILQDPSYKKGSDQHALELHYAGERAAEEKLSMRELERLEELSEQFAQGVPGTETIDHMMELATQRTEAERKLSRHETRLETIEELLRKDVVRNGRPETQPAPGHGIRMVKLILILLGLVSMIGGILGAIYWNRLGYYIAGVGLLLFLIGVLLRRRTQPSETEESEDEEYDTYEDESSYEEESSDEENRRELRTEIEELERQIRRESSIIEEKKMQLSQFLGLYDLEEENQNVGRLLMELRSDLREYELLRAKAARAKVTKEQYDHSVERVREKLASLTMEKQSCERFYRQLCLTREYLTKARNQLGGELQEPLLEAFTKYYQLLDPEEERRFCLDARMNLTFVSHGEQQDVRNLSLGLQELVGVCLRLALVDVMYPEEKVFLIFDDSFANMDRRKIARAIDLVNSVSHTYQILYFTCHEDRCP